MGAKFAEGSQLWMWHNPRCSKSRQTLALIEARGISPKVRLYLEDAPSLTELRAAAAFLGLSPRDFVRTKEAAYKELGLAKVTETELLKAMVSHPVLIERPIIGRGVKAVIGRPPENALELL